MIYSMTGFGRDSVMEDGRGFVIEIKSVNHRYLDLNIRMPRSLISLEEKIRKNISSKISRGKVDVFINQEIYDRDDAEAYLNESLAKSYFECLTKIKGSFDIRDDISVVNIARFPEVVSIKQKEEDFENIWRIMQKGLNNALDQMISMRAYEGEKLKEDILTKCFKIKEYVDAIQKRAPYVVEEYKEKLNDRLKKISKEIEFDENRVSTEIAIFADKASIDEEIVRLNSHINQVTQVLEKDEPIGRKLDFIVQEMNRETNTIASKANDLEIVNNALNIKSEIEKVREQVQNIQ